MTNKEIKELAKAYYELRDKARKNGYTEKLCAMREGFNLALSVLNFDAQTLYSLEPKEEK